MNRSQIAKKVAEILDELFPDPPIPLHFKNGYTFLIAVMLSANSTDRQVNKVTPILFEKASTPQDMVKLSQSEIQSIIRSCGMSQRKSEAILKMSHQVLERHQGEVPQSFEELEALSGVGHKTASVVMSQLFSVPAFPVDTHIQRCAKRWKLSEGKNVMQVEQDLKQLFNMEKWGVIHLQIIFYARKFCPARMHVVEKCPICRWIASLE